MIFKRLLAMVAPWAVALAVNIKLFPALAAIYWVGRREWRPLGIFGTWMSVVVLVVVALWLLPTRWGWAAAIVLPVFATPRLLNDQLSTLHAGMGGPGRRSGGGGRVE